MMEQIPRLYLHKVQKVNEIFYIFKLKEIVNENESLIITGAENFNKFVSTKIGFHIYGNKEVYRIFVDGVKKIEKVINFPIIRNEVAAWIFVELFKQWKKGMIENGNKQYTGN